MSDPTSEPEFDAALRDVMMSLMARASAERRESPAWKDLWSASEHGLESLLSDAESRMSTITLALTDVIKERFGLDRTSPRLYDLIKALPFAMKKLQNGISQEQGMSCCGDKARFTYYQEVRAEIERIKVAQKEGK